MTGENGVIEEDAAAGDSDLALQASESGEPIVDWTECGTCQWMIDAGGCLAVKPNSGSTGELENWGYGVPPWSAWAKSIRSVSFDGVISASNAREMFSWCSSLTSLDLSSFDTSKVTDMSGMFSGCSSLTSLDLSSFNTSNVKGQPGYDGGMGHMFSGCSSLTSLDLSSFNTSNVTGMGGMFSGCSSLTSLDLSSFNTSNVTGMGGMFSGCSSLTSLDLSSFNTSNVTSMGSMFSGCSKLTSLNLSSFNTSNVTSMGSMFSGCSKLAELDLSSFNTSKVKENSRSGGGMSSMFSGCSSLVSLDLSSFDTSSVTGMGDMFSGCSSLISLNLSSFDTSNVKGTGYPSGMSGMFSGCSKLASLDLSSFDTSKVTDMDRMFDGCLRLKSLDLSSFDTKNVASMSRMFQNCQSLESIAFPVALNTSKATDFSGMFSGCRSLERLDVSGFDTSSATSLSSMFSGCSKLAALDVSRFDTSAATSLIWMFSGCSSLGTLDLSGFDTSGISSQYGLSGLLDGCESLRVVTLGPKFAFEGAGLDRQCSLPAPSGDGLTGRWVNASTGVAYAPDSIPSNTAARYTAQTTESFEGWNQTGGCVWRVDDEGCLTVKPLPGSETGQLGGWMGSSAPWKSQASAIKSAVIEKGVVAAQRLDYMFDGCSNLSSADLSMLVTTNVTSMDGLFRDCSSLVSLNISTWDTSNVTSMFAMFNSCTSLKSLDLSSFDTSSVASMWVMFGNCSSLKSLTLSSRFDTSSVEKMDYMFAGCTALTALDVSGFDTSNVKTMRYMFSNCKSLTSLDVSGFDTSKVTNLSKMFSGCSSVGGLNLGNFSTAVVSDMSNMFDGCASLSSLDISHFDTSSASNMSNMFWNCPSLRSLALGDKFSFSGSKEARQCALPKLKEDGLTGLWENAETHEAYAEDEVPNNVAATYIAQMKSEVPKTPINEGMFTVDTAAKTYTGSRIEPSVSSAALQRGTDYTVAYGENVNAGEGTVVITGVGNYAGKVTCTFRIDPRQIDAPEAKAGLVYNGEEQIGVMASGEYAVANESATNAGSYAATVSLKDKRNYAWTSTGKSDDLTVAWSIAKADPPYATPGPISATEGQILGDLELPEGFSWQDDPSTSVGDAGEHEFMATFTPEDTTNYNVVENVLVTANVSKDVDGWSAVGDCVWKVDDRGCLVIKPANGVSGTLENYTTYVVNYLGNLMPKTPWEDQSDEIVSARFEKGVSAGSDLGCIFWQLHKLESVDFSNLDMSRVKSMHDAFRCCESLKRVDGLGSKGGMALEDATEMFSLCRSLVSVDLADVDMSLLSSANYMFANCGSLESLDLPSVLSPRELAGMLSGCSSLERVDLSGLDTRGVRSMRDMFSGCTSLKYVRLGENFSFSGAGSERLCSLPAPWEDGATGIWCNTEGQTFAPSEVPDGAGTYTAVFPKLPDGWKAVGGCAWKIDDQGCLVIKPANGVSGELSGWKGTYDEPGTPWWERASEITSVKVEGRVIAPSSIWGMFKGCEKMASADLRELDAASVVDIRSMFQGCSSLRSVEFPESGMPRVIDVQSAFMDCASLESVDLSFLKGAVIRGNMEGMLSGCSALGAVDLSGLDISKVTGTANLFRGCSSLKSVNLSGLDTSAVTSMNCMFRDCASLKSLDLSTFVTSQLVEMNRMFEGCSSLADLNLSSFDTSKLSCVENRSGMVSVFDGCVSLESVALGEGFTFNGSGTERQCSLPVPSGESLTGSWVDIATGKAYAADEVPNNAAATYCAQRMLLGSDFVVDASDAVYSGEAVVGRVKSDSLNEGTDYDVAYSDNVDAGTVNISITSKGFYAGTLNYTFKINPANITADMVSGVPAKMEATGEQLTPKPTVTFNGKALAEGSDYTVSYGDNKESGKGAVTVAAVEPGNFAGSATVEFDIEKKAESENPDPGTGGGGTDPGTGGGSGGGADPAPTPDPGQGGGSGSGGGAPVPAPEPQQFAITYHLDGGVNAASNPAAFAAGTAVALAAPTREGYEFQGWFADSKFTKRVDGISADASGDVELWAKWAKKAPAPTFPDVDYSESSWYGKAVTYVVERGLITGYTAGEKAGQFGVGDSLTRAQLATILWRNACPEEAASYDPASAKDETGIAGSADGQYYTAAANWAVENGVISGYDRPDGAKDFAADDDVTFEQLVTILARLCATPDELASAGSDLSAFADGGDASSWSRAAFAWAAGKGLVEGYDTDSGKYLAPTEDVARERVAVVLMRAFEMGILK